MRIVFVAVLVALALSACASAPKNTTNSCSIFAQRAGFFENWRRDAERAEREFGVPIPILMATIQVESNFEPRARPPRTKLLGIIPWKHKSTAYGFSQALDGTWERYQRETGRGSARRTNFGDAIHFVGWYHATSNRVNGISRSDARNLYLAYYSGHAGYARGSWRNNAGVQRAADRATRMANQYAVQLRNC